jgi:hypothetical protein
MRAYLLFGQFLKKEGLVTDEDVIKARLLQKETNRLIGERFIEKKWCSMEDVQRILVVQEEEMSSFGDIALELGILTREQIDEVVGDIKQDYIHIGEALVSAGAIDQETKDKKLKEFESLCKSNDEKVSRITLF